MSISATHRNRYTCHFKHFIPLRLCLKGDTCSTFEKVLCDPCQDILGCVYLFSFYFYFCRFHLNHNFCGCLEQQAKVAFEVCFLLLLLFVVVVFKSVLFTFTEGLERRKRRHYYCYYFYPFSLFNSYIIQSPKRRNYGVLNSNISKYTIHYYTYTLETLSEQSLKEYNRTEVESPAEVLVKSVFLNNKFNISKKVFDNKDLVQGKVYYTLNPITCNCLFPKTHCIFMTVNIKPELKKYVKNTNKQNLKEQLSS